MFVQQILRTKGQDVTTVKSTAPISTVIETLHACGIGAVLVQGADGRLAGILSERDIVRGLAEIGGNVVDQPAETLMTRDLVTCAPDDTVDTLLGIMTERRIRHLPVLKAERLVGIVSIGDLVKARIDELENEGQALQRYISA